MEDKKMANILLLWIASYINEFSLVSLSLNILVYVDMKGSILISFESDWLQCIIAYDRGIMKDT